jgi:glutathione S-transferase
LAKLKIYGAARSRAMRVLWMATELGLDFEHVPVASSDPTLKEPAFLKINPAGRIPAIDDNGFVMAESLAINLYLARKYGAQAKPSLAPESLEQEAKIWQWSSWAMTDLENQLGTAFLHRGFYPPEKRDLKLADSCEAQAAKPLAMMDAELGKSDYLLDGRFTLADLNVACVLSMSRLPFLNLTPFPNVTAWTKRCHDRPAAVAARALAAS